MTSLIQRMKIGTKVYLLAGVFFTLAVTLAIYSLIQSMQVKDEILELSHQDTPVVHMITRLSILHLERGEWLQRAIRFGHIKPRTEKTRIGLRSAREKLYGIADRFETLLREGNTSVRHGLNQTIQKRGDTELRKILEDLNNFQYQSRTYNEAVRTLLDSMELDDGSMSDDALNAIEKMQTDLGWSLEMSLQGATHFTDHIISNLEKDEQSLLYGLYLIIAAGMSVGILFSMLLIRMIRRPLTQLSETMRAVVEGGDYSLRVEVTGNDELAEAGAVFNQLLAWAGDQDLLKTNKTRVSRALLKASTPVELARLLLTELMDVTGSVMGAVYLQDDDNRGSYRLAAFAGGDMNPDATHPVRVVGPQQGLVGRCAAERRLLLVNDLPPDYQKIRSGLGESPPGAILFTPITFMDDILGVLEMSRFGGYSQLDIELLEELVSSAGLSLQQLRQSETTRRLLEETRRQAEELEEQQEALQRTNEELEEQSQTLKASEEELQAQNEELEENKDLLEQQNAELEQAQQELEAHAERLSQASRYKSEFLANMSHELRTPLNSLLLLSRNLAGNTQGNLMDDQVDSARIIHESGKDLLHLINDILDLAKIEAGKLTFQATPMELRDLIRELDDGFQPIAQERSLEFLNQVEENVPVRIHADGRRLKQILQNLLSNAFKFTPSGRVVLTVSRLPGGDKPHLAFCVEDTGIGIPEQHRQSVFEVFQQGNGALNRQHGGTGLGLSIARALAEEMGGWIGLESEVEEGSRFTLILPLVESGSHDEMNDAKHSLLPVVSESLAEAPDNRPFISDDRETITASDIVILIIEDDQVFAKEVGRIVHRTNYRFVATDRGESGLALALQFKPMGIILDYGLPDMDGREVKSRLAAHPETMHIPVHVISAGDPDAAVDCGNVIGHLVKPVGIEGIRQALMAIEQAQKDERIGTRILLLTDEPDVSHEIGLVLTPLGYSFVTKTLDGGSDAFSGSDLWDVVILHIPASTRHPPRFLDDLNRMNDDDKPAIIVYADEALSDDAHMTLRRHTDSIIVHGCQSMDRLRADIHLFLRSVDRSGNKKRPFHSTPTSQHGNAILEGARILVVDDDVRNAYSLARVMKDKGISVSLAPNGRKAIGKLEEDQNIDLILMDVMMPEMDGYETIRVLRADPRFSGIPIIVLTAKAMSGDRNEALSAGADDYLSKPVDEDRLFGMLRVWLQTACQEVS